MHIPVLGMSQKIVGIPNASHSLRGENKPKSKPNKLATAGRATPAKYTFQTFLVRAQAQFPSYFGTEHSAMTAPAPVNVGKTPTYKVDYELGIMINYAVSIDAISPYVKAPLTPIAIKMLKTDREAKHYVSLYLAICGMNDDPHKTSRADVFTYIVDEKGQPGMLF